MWDDAKVNLSFETVNAFNLHVDVLGDGVGFLFSSTDDAGAIVAQVVEVIIEGGDMHHPKCHGVGDLDIDAVVFDVGDDRAEALFVVLVEFALVEFKELGLNRFPLGIDAVALGDAKVFAEGIELSLRILDIGFGERGVRAGFAEVAIEYTVHDEIRVTADG